MMMMMMMTTLLLSLVVAAPSHSLVSDGALGLFDLDLDQEPGSEEKTYRIQDDEATAKNEKRKNQKKNWKGKKAEKQRSSTVDQKKSPPKKT